MFWRCDLFKYCCLKYRLNQFKKMEILSSSCIACNLEEERVLGSPTANMLLPDFGQMLVR